MKRKITIIGAGTVGATIGYLLVAKNIASEIVFIDINKDKASGEAIDISQATPFLSPSVVRAGDYEDAVKSDIVIITSGLPRKPGQSRTDLAQANVNILKSIAPKITAYAPNAIYIIVANPVDVLTYAFIKMTNIPAKQVIGSGTSLDTARLRTKLSSELKVNPLQIDCNVFGEHGDTSFVPWSLAKVEGVSIEDYAKIITTGREKVTFNKDETETYVKKSGATIIQQKGVTNYGVAAAVSHICECLYGGVASILCVSVLLNGEYGISDVCLSIPAVLNRKGIKTTLTPNLTEEEQEKLEISANAMKAVINSLDFN